jgi:hypothetical protein
MILLAKTRKSSENHVRVSLSPNNSNYSITTGYSLILKVINCIYYYNSRSASHLELCSVDLSNTEKGMFWPFLVRKWEVIQHFW